jgi:hypothetical protein
MATATLTTAICEVVGREKAGEYGPYHPVLFNLPDGSQKWKSFKPDAPELQWLRKGQSYQAVVIGDEFKLIEPPPAQTPTRPHQPATPSTAIPDDQKQVIASYVLQQSKLFRFCWDEVGRQFEAEELTEESHRTIATTLFIQVGRKFNL